MRRMRRLVARLRRARGRGTETLLVVERRVPRGFRRPVLGLVARPVSRAAAARPGSSWLAVAAYLALIGLDRTVEAGALALRIAADPRATTVVRAHLARLCLSAGRVGDAWAITEVDPADRAPILELVRAEIAFDAGRYGEALDGARLAAAGGLHGGALLADRVAGHIEVLRPGWLPDLGRSAARLEAVRGQALQGRIVHLVSISLPQRLVGYSVRTQSVVRCQAEVGLDPHVVTRAGFPGNSGEPGAALEELVGGIPHHRVDPDYPYVGRPDATLSHSARATAELLASLRPAVLQPASDHLQAQVALALARPLGIPVVYEVRGFWEESWLSRSADVEAEAMGTDRYRMTREVETACMLAADAIVTLSESMRTEIIMRGCLPENVTIVPNAVEEETFRPTPRADAVGATLGIGSRDVVVGYISSFNAYEGIPILLEAVARLRARYPRLKVLLVGDGDEGPVIRETATRLGLDDGTLVMPGRVPHAQILSYYSLIDVFVVPRTAHRVSQLVTPLKPFEAMAMELAVVVSDLPALREIVTPEATGLTFTPGDSDDLAGVLGRLIDDPPLRRRLGSQAREWILAERTWAANGRRYRELFERLGVA